MADWTYQNIDQSGKERKGNIVAESEAEAKNKLKMDGNMVISLTKATALTKEISFSVGGKVKPRDLSVFCRQFTSMVNAGVTILDTLDMLSDQTENKVMAKAIRGVHAEIQKGETLSDGLKKYPNVFPNIMVSMVAAPQHLPVIIDVKTGNKVEADPHLLENQYALEWMQWTPDSKEVTIEYNQRGHHLYQVLAMDAASGKLRTIVEERSDKFVNYARMWRQFVKDGKQLLWTSERDNWNHLYLYDVEKGKVVRLQSPETSSFQALPKPGRPRRLGNTMT